MEEIDKAKEFVKSNLYKHLAGGEARQTEIARLLVNYSTRKMIDENLSMLEMAKRHMDERSILVISDRIHELETNLRQQS